MGGSGPPIELDLRGLDGPATLRGDPIIQGNGIAYEWQLTGTNTGTWSGIPASQQKVNIKGGTIMRVQNGKIFYQADYYDVASLNRQLGW